MRKLSTLLTAALMASVSSTALTSTASAENIAIIGGTVVTMGEAGTIENGTVLISGDRIQSVGAGIAAPSGYRVIDATGQIVTPGLMNAGTTLGVIEVGAVSGTVDVQINGSRGNDNSAPFNAAFDVSYAFNPLSVNIPVTRMEGITRVVVGAGSGESIFGGQSAIADLSGSLGTSVTPRVAMNVTLGESGGSNAGGSRAGAMVYLIRALQEAERYGARGARSIPDRERDSIISQIDAEALAPVVAGSMPMVVSVHRASDILQVLDLKNRFSNLNIILAGAREAWMVADAIAAAGVPVIINPTNDLPGNFDMLGSTLANAGRLEAAGVSISFVAQYPRLMPQAAGIAVAHGMSWDGAMAAMTINPAAAFGVEGYGSLERGMIADVVVWDGDPIEIMSAPTAVIINGEDHPLVSRQTLLRDRYMDLSNMQSNPPANRH